MTLRVGRTVGEWFPAVVGSRQVDPISSLAFIDLNGQSGPWVQKKKKKSTITYNIIII